VDAIDLEKVIRIEPVKLIPTSVAPVERSAAEVP
jgi:hypothetical protein